MRRALLPPVVPLAALLSASVCLALCGCAHDAEERQLEEMRATIEQVQSDRDHTEADMTAAAIADTHLASAGERPPAPALPPPESVQLGDGDGPPGELDSPDTEDPTPRPTLRIFGAPRVGRNAWRDDQVEQSSGDDGSGPPASSALDPEAKPAYDAALALVNARQYDRALDALAAFLVRYPDHPYADNAMYWRGECYFAKGDYLHASEQFEGTLVRFPAGSKAPDALLRLGMSHQKLGNPAKAKECFDRLAQAYPKSEAARHIPPVSTPATTPYTGSEGHR
jgi:tol-pal system protein YbgF